MEFSSPPTTTIFQPEFSDFSISPRQEVLRCAVELKYTSTRI